MNGGIKGSYFAFGLFVILVASIILITVKPIYGQPTPTSVITPCDPKNLTGKWRGNDGGTYFIRQIGDVIWWFGARTLQEGTTFSNVFHGTMAPRDPSGSIYDISGLWNDVPLGNTRGVGELALRTDISGQKLTKVGASGDGFSATEWIKNCRTLPELVK